MAASAWWERGYEDLRVDVREASGRRVAAVTLDLPARRSSMNGAMTRSWVQLMTALRPDGDLATAAMAPFWRATAVLRGPVGRVT